MTALRHGNTDITYKASDIKLRKKEERTMTREIDYAVMDPTGNITILVETPVPEASQPFVADQLMKLEPEAEQVGFLTLPPAGAERDSVPGAAESAAEHAADITPRLSLRMAGGEFCGNASMSAAVHAVLLEEKKQDDVLLNVSGAAEPVRVQVRECGGDPSAAALSAGAARRFHGTVEMPRPVRIREVRLPLEETAPEIAGRAGTEIPAAVIPAVEFEGITHLIIAETGEVTVKTEEEQGKNTAAVWIRRNAEKLAPAWCRMLGAEALGLMFLNEKEGTMTPLVYVPAAGTLVWENSCASGTTAAGAYFSRRNSGGPLRLELRQPGGSLEISAGADGRLFLGGTVRLLRRRRARLAL